jgi:hypothetical protein
MTPAKVGKMMMPSDAQNLPLQLPAFTNASEGANSIPTPGVGDPLIIGPVRASSTLSNSPKVFISSTFVDLECCRKAASLCARRMGFQDIAMEYFTAEDRRPVEACLEAVRNCDLYVGIFAWRYGYVPGAGNPDRQAITEMEYRQALATNKHCIILLLDADAPWPRTSMDTDTTRIDALRQALRDRHVCAFFNSAEDIGQVLAPALHHWCDKHFTTETGAGRSRRVRVSTAKLPSTNPILVGRNAELRQLHAAWLGRKTRVLSVIASGGMGKSSLVNSWVNELALQDWPDAELVYGWSFYRQGLGAGVQTSSDLFLASALAWFGDPDPDQGSAWDKGERLAGLVRTKRTLLLLDGVEPLQTAPQGKLRDEGLEALLRELARFNPGLCVITSRFAIEQLKDVPGDVLLLDRLPNDVGTDYLRMLGVQGTQDEISMAVDDFKGHPLALTLLGSYLVLVYGGAIQMRTEIGSLTEEPSGGSHARRMIESYERWFAGCPEQKVCAS